MQSTTKFIGLDVSKEKIAVAIAEAGREEPRWYGTIPHTAEALRKLIKQLGDKETLSFCYEAGPTGYEAYRWITSMGAQCYVIAPTLIPKRAGDRIKTDRRDALQLARLFRAGELTSIYIPTREDEALRDLIRARSDAREDLHRARQRLIKFLLRQQIHPPVTIKRRWTQKYRNWLDTLKFETQPAHQAMWKEYKYAVHEAEQRQKRLEASILEEASKGAKASIIHVLQSLRGIALLTAVTIAAEIGSFKRFRSPAQLMAYLGLVPREHSSGQTVRRGSMTKAGNAHLRRAIIEASWSYRYSPAVKGELAERLNGQSAEVQAISWKAQERLHGKYKRLVYGKGRPANIAIGAVARELTGFIWAVAHTLEES